ncbi:Lysosome membrane protein 2, partial [Pseudolycoriella hygida]
MNKLLILLALAVCGVASETVEQFVQELKATDASSAHGNRFLLCSESPWERTLEVTFFSVVNQEGFLNGERPVLRETEPVFLDELRTRVNCSVNIEDMSINYGQNRYWSGRSGDFNQRVNTANIPFQRLGHVLCNDGTGECMPSLVSSGEGYLKEATINELLIKGTDLSSYKNELSAHPHISGDYPELERDSFAILSQLYYPKKFTVSSDEDTYGKIKLMDDQSELLWWKSNNENGICSQFPSTTGETFLGKVTERSILHYYSEDVCGSAILKYDSVDNSFGFPALKFVSYPETNGGDCFKTPSNLPYGAVDVKSCQRGLPFMMSYPHFLDADASYRNQLSGLNADASKHQTYFIIEPVTGMLVESSQKYQLNVEVKKFKSHESRSMVDTILPVYWFNKHSYQCYQEHVGQSS